jgi:hypothetical protein
MSNELRVGQVPSNPLTITVAGGDLTDYTTVAVEMRDPLGEPVTLAGDVSVDGAVVSYDFDGVSPFETPGDHKVRLRLEGPGAVLDYTTDDVIEVYR